MTGHGGFGGLMLMYGTVWLVVVGVMLTAFWRGMRAQEKMAQHLEAIERSLAQRSGSL
jgi:hypothetical protein